MSAAPASTALAVAPDAGLVAAVIVAVGVTALVALGMALHGMRRQARLTAARGVLTGAVGVGVVALAVAGVVVVSPASAQAQPDQHAGPTYVVTTGADTQLPTLPLGD